MICRRSQLHFALLHNGHNKLFETEILVFNNSLSTLIHVSYTSCFHSLVPRFRRTCPSELERNLKNCKKNHENKQILLYEPPLPRPSPLYFNFYAFIFSHPRKPHYDMIFQNRVISSPFYGFESRF